MLKIIKELHSKRAKNPEHGNVQYFLERLLVDVAAANYRYFLNDYLSKTRSGHPEPEKTCHPPLLENEKQVAGLFASALAGFSPVFKPEFPLAGELDFLVTHGEREIALENKRVTVASVKAGAEVSKVTQKWREVVEQSRRRLDLMRKDRKRFRHPTSVGLLIVRVSEKVRFNENGAQDGLATKLLEKRLQDLRENAGQLGRDVSRSGSAHFVASYEFPRAMQIVQGWRTEKHPTDERVFPGVVFLAHVKSLS